jgi:hypothetical protein
MTSHHITSHHITSHHITSHPCACRRLQVVTACSKCNLKKAARPLDAIHDMRLRTTPKEPVRRQGPATASATASALRPPLRPPLRRHALRAVLPGVASPHAACVHGVLFMHAAYACVDRCAGTLPVRTDMARAAFEGQGLPAEGHARRLGGLCALTTVTLSAASALAARRTLSRREKQRLGRK